MCSRVSALIYRVRVGYFRKVRPRLDVRVRSDIILLVLGVNAKNIIYTIRRNKSIFFHISFES